MASLRTGRTRTSLAQRVVATIVDNGLQPGTPLPTEAQLMVSLQASRNSVREALKALQALGLVEIRHGYGTFVGNASLDAARSALVFRARLGSQSRREVIRDLTELRELLEMHFIEATIRDATERDLDELDLAVEEMRRPERHQAADRRFHEILYRSCSNRLVLEFVGFFWDSYADVQASLPPTGPDSRAIAEGHRAIATAVRSKNVEAAQAAIRLHFDDVRARTR
jgi:DNA-binding FadR family transcriptional regulator